ncbi:unnamed protein product, partial [Dovyalis caffra]
GVAYGMLAWCGMKARASNSMRPVREAKGARMRRGLQWPMKVGFSMGPWHAGSKGWSVLGLASYGVMACGIEGLEGLELGNELRMRESWHVDVYEKEEIEGS